VGLVEQPNTKMGTSLSRPGLSEAQKQPQQDIESISRICVSEPSTSASSSANTSANTSANNSAILAVIATASVSAGCSLKHLQRLNVAIE
jgi:hypothetical protein